MKKIRNTPTVELCIGLDKAIEEVGLQWPIKTEKAVYPSLIMGREHMIVQRGFERLFGALCQWDHLIIAPAPNVAEMVEMLPYRGGQWSGADGLCRDLIESIKYDTMTVKRKWGEKFGDQETLSSE